MRKRKLTFLILVAVMIVALIASVAACDPDDPEEEKPSYSTTLVTNGNFDDASGEEQPMSPSGWTGEAGSTSSSAQYKTPTDNVHSGVIDVSDERGYRSEFGSVTPGKVGEDNNILAIYNGVEASSYKYTSSSITLSADRVYRLSVWVKTDIFTDASYYGTWLNRNDETQALNDATTGAYVSVSGVAYAAFDAINTNGEWQELVTYIDTHGTTGGSVTITLSLGTGNWSTGHMAAGYAFFDNITMVDLNDEYQDPDSTFVKGDGSLSDEQADAKASAEFAAATQGTSSSKMVNGKEQESAHAVHTSKYDMSVGDTAFDYATKTSTPYSPSRWTGSSGKKTDGTSFSTSSSNLQKGILDAASGSVSLIDNNSSYEGLTLDAHDSLTYTYSEGHARTIGNVLFINAKNANVYGYSSNTTYTIEANNYYKISVWVKTYINSGNGAAVRLTSGDDDENIVSQSNISTNGEWQEVSLYLRGNQYRENTVTLELWLGDNNTAGTVGMAFFDSVSVSKISEEEYNAAPEGAGKKDMLTPDADFKYYGMDGSQNVLSYQAKAASDSRTALVQSGTQQDGLTVNKALERGGNGVWLINNPTPAYSAITPVIAVDTNGKTVNTDNLIPLYPNEYLSLSVWVKTSEITSGGLTVSVYNYDIEGIKEDLEDAPGKTDYADLSDYRTSVASLSSLTSEGLEDFKIDGVNDYVMLTFMIQGGKTTAHLGFEFTLGSGTESNSSSYVKGWAMISNIMTEKITAADYSAASTASNVAKGSISSSAASVEVASNGYFNVSDISGTNSLYADDENEFDFNTYNTAGVLALPDGWTATDSSLLKAYLNKNGDEPATNYAFGGVVDPDNDTSKKMLTALLKSGDIHTLLSGSAADIFASAGKYSGLSEKNNLLAVYSHNLLAFGFSSEEMSLSANSYYRVSVWAYAESGSQITVVISTGSDDTEYYFFENGAESGWKEYVFYIQTGVSSISASLSLYVGNANYDNGGDAENVGDQTYAALFTGATYQSVTEEDFDAYIAMERANSQTLSMLVDTMDNVTENTDSLNTPSSWTGSQIDSDASSDDVTAGVFDRENHDWDELLDLDIAGNEEDKALSNRLFDASVLDKNINNAEITTGIGDMVLVIYNHDDVRDDEGNLSGGAYSYQSSSMTLSAGSYYKITVWVLTYKLGENDSARVILKLGNSSYTFGTSIDDESSAVDKVRRINTKGQWQEVSFYVYIDKDVEESVTGTLTLQLGDTDEWVSGYLFADNFSCVEIDEKEVDGATVTPAQTVSGMVGFEVVVKDAENAENNNDFSDSNAYNADGTIKDGAKLASNYIVHYTQADAEKAPEEEETTEDDTTNDLLWLYIVSGIIGGLIVIAVIIVIARKVMSKRKRQKQVNKKSDFDRNYGNRSNVRKK